MVEVRQKRLPEWLRVPFKGAKPRAEVRRLLKDLRLHTVCQSANCPNLCECWGRKTATFMILGDTCTRNCGFCAVKNGCPGPPDPSEPERVAQAAAQLQLKFVVITSVTRDDLPDGGASLFAETLRAVHEQLPGAGTEVLTPDFGGRRDDIATVIDANPTVFNHNIETCRRLAAGVRPDADYDRSLSVLRAASELSHDGAPIVKSGLMIGMGETPEEIRTVLSDLREAGVRSVTIGQYLPPSSRHWPLDRYVRPEEFDEWGAYARDEIGFEYLVSAPLVRSSYMADQATGPGTPTSATAALRNSPPPR